MSDSDCILLSLPVRFSGLAIPQLDVKYEYENSRKLILSLTQLIKDQCQIYSVNEAEQKSIKTNIKIDKKERYKATLIKLRTHLNENQKHLNDKSQVKGVSNWLKTCLISDQVHDF